MFSSNFILCILYAIFIEITVSNASSGTHKKVTNVVQKSTFCDFSYEHYLSDSLYQRFESISSNVALASLMNKIVYKIQSLIVSIPHFSDLHLIEIL